MSSKVEAFKEKNAERNEKYLAYVERMSPKQSAVKSLLKAALVGGIICCIGQMFYDLSLLFWPSMDKMIASALASLMLIFLTCLLTGIGIFDKIALIGGAGTFLPISGFANSISSSAIEFKSEGMIFGLSSKFFSIAGAIIINGVMGSFVVGLIYWVIGLFGG